MNSIRPHTILGILFLACLFHMSYTLKCKVCQKNEAACLLGQDVETRTCANATDVCFSWFDRTRSTVGVQRDCISPDTDEYKMLKQMIDDNDGGCVKRINGLDCFTFCSVDVCN